MFPYLKEGYVYWQIFNRQSENLLAMNTKKFREFRRGMGIIVLALLLSLSSPASAYSMQRVTAIPYDDEVGELTSYYITFEPIQTVPKGGYVKITFPEGFVLDPGMVSVRRTTLCDLVLEDVRENTVILLAWKPVLAKVICTVVLSNIQNSPAENKYNIVITTTDAVGNVIDGPTCSAPFKIKKPSATAVAMASIISEKVMATDASLSSGAASETAVSAANAVEELISLVKEILNTLA